MSATTLRTGSLFAGRYRILDHIGAGGFGSVYEGVHTVTERPVAIKVLWPEYAEDPQFRARFLRECRLAARIGSEFIVDVLDAGIDDDSGLPFLVMELLKGENLATRVARKRAFGAEETIVYLSHVAAALDRTHERDIVHRDLKPGNLFLTQRTGGVPLVKVLDFGVAKLIGSSNFGNESHTMGTPLYMAPEQLRGRGVTSAIDIYSLAMIAFRFLAGASFFRIEEQQSATVEQLARWLERGPTEDATQRALRYGATLPAAFGEWFARVANPVPSERPERASQAIVGLCQVLGVEPRPPLVPHVRMPGALSFGLDVDETTNTEQAAPSQPSSLLGRETADLSVAAADVKIRR